jgi:hypothetical protein
MTFFKTILESSRLTPVSLSVYLILSYHDGLQYSIIHHILSYIHILFNLLIYLYKVDHTLYFIYLSTKH